jgi:hypothetical protein
VIDIPDDPHDILGLSYGFSKADLKKAYVAEEDEKMEEDGGEEGGKSYEMGRGRARGCEKEAK